MKSKLSILLLCLLAIGSPFFLKAQPSKESCLNWENIFPKVESRMYLEISDLDLIIDPPSAAYMRSTRAGERVPITKGSFSIENNKEVHVAFTYDSGDPDECAITCKEQAKFIHTSKDANEVYDSCVKSCKDNTNSKYGKDQFKLPIWFRIYRDESDQIRVDSILYKDPNPVLGRFAYTFPHYFAGDLVKCSAHVWDFGAN
ncbi:hypothetical protein EHQ53_07170 [Leptospira langatensis]|uniref:Uncharacterized protein n=1 Tax=Leptospira langatensis TaxID=2484983 RepID=A0A5F1ZU38_9LEPT|nr:hypothetical protein EHO57_11700 [Leptospira langatensis]TGL41973.1 hypothetical protein EHQ53_07170 [Leptospira langatensis]